MSQSQESSPLLREQANLLHAPSNKTRYSTDAIGLIMILTGLLLFVPSIWFHVLIYNDPSLFSLHPIAQSLAIALVLIGVTTLQPTSKDYPRAKNQAFNLHRWLNAVALLSFLVGATAIYLNKANHGAKHFTSWHGTLGLITIGYFILQAIIGVVQSTPYLWNILGGQRAAKGFWKYHRLSAYGILIPLLIVTPFIGAAQSDWALGNTNFWVRVVGAYGGLGLVSFGLLTRVRLEKFGF